MKTVLLIFIILVLTGCERTTEPEPINNPPILKEIVVYPGAIGGPWSYDLIAVAIDKDGDSLIYVWDSQGGYFISMDGYRALWAADSLGQFRVRCIVNDGKATDDLEIIINVIG